MASIILSLILEIEVSSGSSDVWTAIAIPPTAAPCRFRIAEEVKMVDEPKLEMRISGSSGLWIWRCSWMQVMDKLLTRMCLLNASLVDSEERLRQLSWPNDGFLGRTRPFKRLNDKTTPEIGHHSHTQWHDNPTPEIGHHSHTQWHRTVHMALMGYFIVFSFVTKPGQTLEFLLWGTIVPLNFLAGYYCSIVASTPQPTVYASMTNLHQRLVIIHTHSDMTNLHQRLVIIHTHSDMTNLHQRLVIIHTHSDMTKLHQRLVIIHTHSDMTNLHQRLFIIHTHSDMTKLHQRLVIIHTVTWQNYTRCGKPMPVGGHNSSASMIYLRQVPQVELFATSNKVV